MTVSQLISLGLLAFGLNFWAYLCSRPPGRRADRVATEPASAGQP
jgi:hypothetical protein